MTDKNPLQVIKPPSTLPMWVVCIVFPAPAALYGFYCLLTGTVLSTFVRKGNYEEVISGPVGHLMGLVFISFAISVFFLACPKFKGIDETWLVLARIIPMMCGILGIGVCALISR